MAATSSQSVDDVRLRRGRLGSVLATLQSLDFLVETFAPSLPGGEDGGGWAVVTVLEAWKSACRLRLLGTLDPGELLRSFAIESEQEQLVDVVRRLRHAAAPHARRAPASRHGPNGAASASDTAAAAALYVGETLHALQPLVYLGLLFAQVRGARLLAHGWRRRIPWLTALLLEAAGLGLCTIGAHRLERKPASSTRSFAAGHARENGLELAHRRMLLALFLMRPAACAALRRLLMALAIAAGRSSGSYAGGAARALLRAWCSSALQMIEHLETQIWARYWRTSERLR